MDYLGVEKEILLELGKISVVASRVESLGHQIAEALGVSGSEQSQFGAVIKAVKKQLREVGVHRSLTGERAEIQEWADNAIKSMNGRNDPFHSVSHLRRISDKWVAEATQIRSKETTPQEVEPLVLIRTALEASMRKGYEVLGTLMHPCGEGAFMSHRTWLELNAGEA